MTPTAASKRPSENVPKSSTRASDISSVPPSTSTPAVSLGGRSRRPSKVSGHWRNSTR